MATEQHNPVGIVLGAPRSGTSLVYRALCLHPDAAWISNWTRRTPTVPALAVLNRLAGVATRTRNRVWFGDDGGNAYVYSGARGAWERAFPQPTEGEPLFRAHGVPDEPSTQFAGTAQQQRSFAAALASVRRWSGGRVLVNKRIANNRRIPFLLGVDPRARFVEVVRDGRPVALSLRKVDWWPDSPIFWADTTPRAWEAAGRDPWELAARHWVEEVRELRAGTELIPPAQLLRIRFADLVASSDDVLHEVAAFLGLRPSSQWDTDLAHLRFPADDERWRTEDADVIGGITEWQADELDVQGFSR